MSDATKDKKDHPFKGIHLPSHPIGNVILTIISGVILLYLGKLLFDHSRQPGTPITTISRKDTAEKKPLVSPIVHQDTTTARKTRDTAFSTHAVSPADKIARYDFAIAALTNEKPDASMGVSLQKWIQDLRPLAPFSAKTILLESPDFQRLNRVAGTSTNFNKAASAIATKYLCTLDCAINYTESSLNASLTVANGKYELKVIDLATGSILYSKEKLLAAAELTNDLARQRVDSLYIGYLKNEKIKF
jgi:hypothetical protein